MKFSGELRNNAELQSKALREVNRFIDVFKSGNKRKIYKLTDKQFRKKYSKKGLWIPLIDSIEIKEISLKTEVMIDAFIEIKGFEDNVRFKNVYKIRFIAQKKAYTTNSKSRFLFNPLSECIMNQID